MHLQYKHKYKSVRLPNQSAIQAHKESGEEAPRLSNLDILCVRVILRRTVVLY
jgi:hypothetical protein